MASEKEGSIYDDPNFAVISSFLANYAKELQFPDISFNSLKSYIGNSKTVHRLLEDVFIRLLRKWRKGRCGVDEWEKVLVKFCYTYSDVDAWELERFGYPRCKVSTKLRILKNLLETQFDCHTKFKEKLNNQGADSLRCLPVGRDKHGMAYWLFLDHDSNIRIYREEQDDTEDSQSWKVLVKDYEGLKALINTLEEDRARIITVDSRAVTPLYGSGSLTPSQNGSRCNTPAVEVKEVIKPEIKQEAEVEGDNEKPDRAPLKMIIKREPGVKAESGVKQEETLKAEIKEEIESKPSEVKKLEDSDKENSTMPKESIVNTQQTQSIVNTQQTQSTESQSTSQTSISGNKNAISAQELSEKLRKMSQDEKSESNSKPTESDAQLIETEGQNSTSKDTTQVEKGLKESQVNDSASDNKAVEKDNQNQDAAKIIVKTKTNEESNELSATSDDKTLSDGNDKCSDEENIVTANEVADKETKPAIAKETIDTKQSSDQMVPIENETTENKSSEKDQNSSNGDLEIKETPSKTPVDSKEQDVEKSYEKNVVAAEPSKSDDVIVTDEKKTNDHDDNGATNSINSPSEKEPKSPVLDQNVENEIKKEESKNEINTESVAETKCTSPPSQHRYRKGVRNRRAALALKTSPKSPAETSNLREKMRKRKRGGEDSEDEAEHHEAAAEPTDRKQIRSESELSESSQSEGELKEEEDGPPSKRRRDKFLKKRKPVRQEAHESTSDSEEPEKKTKRSSDEESEIPSRPVKSPKSKLKDKKNKRSSPAPKTTSTEPSPKATEKFEGEENVTEEVKEIENNENNAPSESTKESKEDKPKVDVENDKEAGAKENESSEKINDNCDQNVSSPTTNTCTPNEDKQTEPDLSVVEKDPNIVKKKRGKRRDEKQDSNGEEAELEIEAKKKMRKEEDAITESTTETVKEENNDVNKDAKKKRVKRREDKETQGEELAEEVEATKKKKLEEISEPNTEQTQPNEVNQKPQQQKSNELTTGEGENEELNKKRGKKREETDSKVEADGNVDEQADPTKKKKLEENDLKSEASVTENGEKVETTEPKATKAAKSRGRRVKQKQVEAAIPVENLRRSSRSNKGQRAIDPGVVPVDDLTPRKKRAIKTDQTENEDVQDDEPIEKRGKKATKTQKESKGRKKKGRGRKTEEEDTDYSLPVSAVQQRAGKKNRRTKKGRPRKYGSTSDEEEDDEEGEEDLEEIDQGEESEPLHWSSASETEYEFDSDGAEYQPTGRNAKRQAQLLSKEGGVVPGNDDTPCRRCAKYDQPQWILLCDECEAGYHTACLRPPLMLIPDGDWFCPTCEHIQLIVRLTAKLKELDGEWKRKDALDRRKQRLKFVGISLDNILQDDSKPKARKKQVIESSASENENEAEEEKPEVEVEEDESEATDEDQGHWETLKEKTQREKENRKANQDSKYYYDWGTKYKDQGSTLSSSSETEVESSSSSTEEEYSMVANRSRRQRKEIKYDFDEYDNIITSAIKQEDAVTEYKPNPRNRGKDISNIEEEYEREKAARDALEPQSSGQGMGKGPRAWDGESEGEEDQDGEKKEIEGEEVEEKQDEYANKPSPVVNKSKRGGRRKGRRLNALSEDDADDDTDEYQASYDEPSASDNYSDDLTDDSLVKRGTRGKSSRRRRTQPRMDDFVVDEYDSEEERASYRRAKRGRTTRASHRRKPRRGTNRRGDSSYDSEEEEAELSLYSDSFTEDESGDSSDSGPSKRRKGRSKSKKSKKAKHKKSDKKKRKRKIKYSEESSEELSEHRKRKSSKRYEEDSDWSDDNYAVGKRAAAKRISYKEPAYAGSDFEDSPNKKKKGKMDMCNFVKGSEDEASGTDEYAGNASDSNEDSGPVSSRNKHSAKTNKTDLKNNHDTNSSNKAHRRIKRGPIESSDDNDDKAAAAAENDDVSNTCANTVDSKNSNAVKSAAKTPENISNQNSNVQSSPEIGNNPVTYTFKAKVNGQREGKSELSKKTVSDIRGSISNGSDVGSETEVEDDELSDIGDIVDYLTQDV